jgi:hypothetical protein
MGIIWTIIIGFLAGLIARWIHPRAVAFDMLLEPHTGASLGQYRCERGLADLQRVTPNVVPVQFDEVEGV